ncbi:MAG: magnesium transporter [Anaerolineales bacterium]|nr:magnesium transporter [Anaerolineales bacterium]MCB8939459.1 magnesium transporter [Ardenticatenaceae bacterium]
MSESEQQVQAWLKAGITAVKQGDRVQGRQLLEKVLAADERNETAWLWLSGAVETTEERQICLENVLAINPDNQMAQKGLAKLAKTAPAESGKTQTVRREYAPVSTAAALLYPEDQVKTWEWRDPTAVQNTQSTPGFKAQEKYDDIWTKTVPICGYCAQELAPDDERCPRCKKKLVMSSFRYPDASANLTIFWVLVLGVSQFFLLQLLYNILAQRNMLAAAGSGIMVAILAGLALGIAWRQTMAHVLTIYLFIAIILFFLLRWILPPDWVMVAVADMDPAIQQFVLPLASGLGEVIRIFIMTGSVLGLFYAVVKAGPDFDQVSVRQVATLTKGPTSAADFNAAALRLARNGLWATAVLHWQNAAAKAPQQISYQESLGRAYATLGFYERSLDVLQSARQRTSSPERQVEIEQQIQAVQAKNLSEKATEEKEKSEK